MTNISNVSSLVKTDLHESSSYSLLSQSQLTHTQKKLKLGEPLITLKLATGNVTPILV